jgi:mono/diheme cytochrome c family protein
MTGPTMTPYLRAGQAQTRAWSWYWLAGILVLGGLGLLIVGFFERHALERPLVHADPMQEFLYGSVGTDMDNGLPLAVIEILPRAFPEYLPADDSPRDWRAFGFITAENGGSAGHRMPLGFSERRRVIDFTGPNCAVCHTGRVITPDHPQGRIIPGMPANTVDLQAFFQFLFACAGDRRFTPDHLIPLMDAERPLGPVERVAYRLVIPILQGQLLARKAKLAHYFGDASSHPRWGPGRVDTFNTFKFDQFADLYADIDIPISERYGTVDLPPIWSQDRRHGLWLHWDGNNDSVRERNFSAALAAGASLANLEAEKDRLFALQAWLEYGLKPPPYPFPIDQALAARGEPVYRQRCADCHAFDGGMIGQVTPIEAIGTDRGRLDSYTEQFRQIQRAYTAEQSFAFRRFRKTAGYANLPLDGLWARAPYLHNGSVPTLADLLSPEDRRPERFHIGDIVYDPARVGFRHHSPSAPDGRALMVLDTGLYGNGNQGHSGPGYGTDLPDDDKRALIEYLKTL